MKAKAVLLGDFYHPAGMDLLSSRVNTCRVQGTEVKQLASELSTVDALYVRYPNRVTAEMIDISPNLRVIATSGRGTDSVDIAAATARGIAVVNNPGLSTHAVAEQAIAMMLALARHIPNLDRAVRAGRYNVRDEHYQLELAGRTLGVVGMGNIGSEVARIAINGFRMRVLAYDPYVPATKFQSLGCEQVATLDELLYASDIVTLHPELNAETTTMIGHHELALMGEHALLINTSRGKVVNERDLTDALAHRTIAGAALDVFTIEPPELDNALFELDNVILSPHVGGVTENTARAISLSAATQMLQVLAGEQPTNLVNPDVWNEAASRQVSS